MRYATIPIAQILLPPRLHRVALDEEALDELAASIREEGLHQPIVVSEIADHYRLEAGHRRLIAHQRLGRDAIEAKVYEPGDQVDGERVRWSENLQREDLTPMEQGAAIEHARDALHLALPDIARMLHRSGEWVESRLALIALPDELTLAVHERRLGIAAALELGRVEDPEHRQYLLRYTLDAGATLASVREWVRQWEMAHERGDAANAPRPDPVVPGQAVMIQIPCLACGGVLPHDQLRIVRLCPACAGAVAGAGARPPDVARD